MDWGGMETQVQGDRADVIGKKNEKGRRKERRSKIVPVNSPLTCATSQCLLQREKREKEGERKEEGGD